MSQPDKDISEKTPLLASADREKVGVPSRASEKKSEIREFRFPAFPACRHIIALMGFLGSATMYMVRINLSVALVSMVGTQPDDNSTIMDTECLPDEIDNTTATPPASGEFHWTKQQQGIILGAFFYGYVTTQFIGGRLAERFGGKHVFGTGLFVTSLLTLVTPVAARQSWILLVVIRILEGMFSGIVYPSIHAILSKWAPPYERTKLGIIIFTGPNLGTVLAMSLSGVLSTSLGWPSAFYFFGALGCLWWVSWMFLMYSSPSQHPRISAAEREYIETALNTTVEKKVPTPWLGIFTSLPFWAILLNSVTNNFGYYVLLTCLPQFMNDILHFDLSANGVLSALPYLVGWIVALFTGQIVDYLRAKRIARTVVVRKVVTISGQLLSGIFLILAGYVGCQRGAAVALIVLAGVASAIINNGVVVNHLDIAPRFAGTLLGLTNTFAGIPGIVAPMVVETLTEKENTREQWMLIFYITAAIYGVGGLIYLVFASGVEQDWAKVSVVPVSRQVDASLQVDSEKAPLVHTSCD